MFFRSVISSLEHGYTRHQEAVQEEISDHRLSEARLHKKTAAHPQNHGARRPAFQLSQRNLSERIAAYEALGLL